MSYGYDENYDEGYEQQDAGLTPKGTYRARAQSWGLGLTGGDKEQIAITFKLLDYPGKLITYYGSFSDAALDFTVKAMRTCGWVGEDLSDLTGLDANEVSLVVDHNTYEGKKTAKVKWVNAAGSIALKKQLDPEAAKSFAERMRGAIASVDAKLGMSSRAGTPPRAARRSTEADPRDFGYVPPRDDRDAPPPRGRTPQRELEGNGFDSRRDPSNPDHW